MLLSTALMLVSSPEAADKEFRWNSATTSLQECSCPGTEKKTTVKS